MSVYSSACNSFALSEKVIVTFEFVAFVKICRPMIGWLKMDKNNSSVILNK
jgi:hypothetical protein